MDTLHELLVYKIDHKKFDESDTSYMDLPSTRFELNEPNASKPIGQGLALNSKDSLLISSCLCSTKLTQNVDLLGLLKYQSSQSQQLPAILNAFMKVDSKEVVKFLQDVLDALFNILMLNSDSDAFDRSVFDCLVFIIGLVTDRNYEHFKVTNAFHLRKLNESHPLFYSSPCWTCTSGTTLAQRLPTRSCSSSWTIGCGLK